VLISGATITEHLDLDFPLDDTLFKFNIAEYLNKYGLFTKKYNIGLGLEIGLKENTLKKADEIIKNNNFDFVIGSIHLVNNMDLYYDEFYRGKTKNEAYNEYLTSVRNCIKEFNNYDSLGHIDYICRYSPYEDKEIYYEEFKGIIDEILKILIKNKKCLEVNTKRLKNESAYLNIKKILEAFKGLGGKYVTIGSDAHKEEDLGMNFERAITIINEVGLKSVYFRERRIFSPD
jgi:histidinol-phosphatase (PHP family)